MTTKQLQDTIRTITDKLAALKVQRQSLVAEINELEAARSKMASKVRKAVVTSGKIRRTNIWNLKVGQTMLHKGIERKILRLAFQWKAERSSRTRAYIWLEDIHSQSTELRGYSIFLEGCGPVDVMVTPRKSAV